MIYFNIIISTVMLNADLSFKCNVTQNSVLICCYLQFVGLNVIQPRNLQTCNLRVDAISLTYQGQIVEFSARILNF